MVSAKDWNISANTWLTSAMPFENFERHSAGCPALAKPAKPQHSLPTDLSCHWVCGDGLAAGIGANISICSFVSFAAITALFWGHYDTGRI